MCHDLASPALFFLLLPPLLCTSPTLMIAAGYPRCAEVLLTRGASVRKDCDGSPPLHMAVCLGLFVAKQQACHELVDLLLSQGADALEG